MSKDAERRAARALADGDVNEVLRALADAAVDDDDARARWALMLLEAGEIERAAELAEKLSPRERAKLEPLLEVDRVPLRTEEDDEEDALDAIELRPVRGGAEDAAVVREFLRFFGGRRDLYAQQWHDARRGRSGYRPVREPLTEAVARAHLAGRRTIGQYLLWPDDTVSFAVIDLDLSRSAKAELEAGHGEGSALRHPALRAYTSRTIEHARRLHVPLFAEDSGSRGVHLWLFFEPRRPARAARALLARIVEAAGAPPADVGVEIFPKQERAGQRGLSSLVKLPLGVHQATMRPCLLLDDALEPIEDPSAALARLRPVSPEHADAILSRRLFALPSPTPFEKAPDLPKHGSPRSLAKALRDVPDGRPAREAAERMLESCAVLRELANRAYRPEGLRPDEARALIYSVGLVGKTPALAVEILAAAQVPMRELHRVRGGLPSPVGCRRLRELRVAECRGCPRGAAAQPYPTPAVFAVGAVPCEPPRHAKFAAWLEPATGLEPDALEDLASKLETLEQRLERIEERAMDARPGTSAERPEESRDEGS